MTQRSSNLIASNLIEDLAKIVGDQNVLTGEDVSRRSDCYLPIHPMEADCIARPATTEEVSAIAAYCDCRGLALVPQGGRTGLAGGAYTKPGDVALSLERMTAISPVDPFGLTIEVQAGAPLQAVQEAADAAGLLYPVDLGARGSATIGGTVATNAGGNAVLRYGMTREQVLGLEVVLADGTVLSSMNRLIKNNAAYDLKHMFVGSEGTLGIITRAILRLRPKPGQKATAFIGVSSFEAVLDLLGLASAEADGALTSYEVMWPSFLDIVVGPGGHRMPLEGQHAFCVLAEIVSRRADEQLERIIGLGWEQGLIENAAIAQNMGQASSFWAIRDDIEALLAGVRPLLLYDVSLPQAHMAGYVENLDAALRSSWKGTSLAVFGHVADGNLHLVIRPDEDVHHDAIDALVYSPLEELGGSISAEHGIGLEKRRYLHYSRSAEEISMMARLKAALDPRSTLNPGKVIPTTRTECREGTTHRESRS
jgi:FAD/FMN-containing dehydrogenase